MKPSEGGRKWIKLWVNEWLDGTTRWQTTGAQRAFWADLLAWAGRGRVGGVVCSGRDGDVLIGYPLRWFEALSPEPIDVLETLALFERTGKIRVEISSDKLKLYVVHILNWDRYQSEYQRTKKYREKKTKPATPNATEKLHGKSHAKSQKCYTPEVEVDSEPESDSEPEKTKHDQHDVNKMGEHDTSRPETGREAAARTQTAPINAKPEPKERHFDNKDLLTRFALSLGYSISEADGRLGWIFHRANHRKEYHNPIGPHVHNDWAYIVKANKNLDAQLESEPGGPDRIIEKYSFAKLAGFKLRTCPDCGDSVIVGTNCDCKKYAR